MNNLSTFSSKPQLTLGGVLLSTALIAPLYAHGYYKTANSYQSGSFELKSTETPETFSAVQIRPYNEEMSIDDMLITVFERMSKESTITDDEIARIMSDNMLDLLL
jgi:hypothetical protein